MLRPVNWLIKTDTLKDLFGLLDQDSEGATITPKFGNYLHKNVYYSNKTGPFNKAAVRDQRSARAAGSKTMHGVSSSLRDTQETNTSTIQFWS
jgi:hypothetical protein